MNSTISRRTFLAGASTAAASALVASSAIAEEAKSEQADAQTESAQGTNVAALICHEIRINPNPVAYAAIRKPPQYQLAGVS